MGNHNTVFSFVMMAYQDTLADDCQKQDDVLIFQIIHLKDK